MAKMMMMKSAMKAMKMKKSMKAMVMKKAMKKRAMKKTAKSYKTTSGARAAVFSGKIMKSKGGLKKEAFTKSKTGKIVSKKASANGKKAYKRIAEVERCRAEGSQGSGLQGLRPGGWQERQGRCSAEEGPLPVQVNALNRHDACV